MIDGPNTTILRSWLLCPVGGRTRERFYKYILQARRPSRPNVEHSQKKKATTDLLGSGGVAFSEYFIFFVPLPFSLCMESTS